MQIQDKRHPRNQGKSKKIQLLCPGYPLSMNTISHWPALIVYMNVLVLNGYHNIDSLKGIEDQDLISLGIMNSDHRLKLLNAIDYIEDLNFSSTISSDSVDSHSHTSSTEGQSFPFLPDISLVSQKAQVNLARESNVRVLSPLFAKVANTDSYPESSYV
ncbi:hypothetical protein CEXT_150581 [Caerostris extrusa]|uniref:SAM domain-containing protein n=1 Tax=Caerostris extrusa TaxID=172846 RepID=A0AAV4Q9P8_CAEEX|nr:hypothetical protein CEXT_150581 [Caerostris extrusa]